MCVVGGSNGDFVGVSLGESVNDGFGWLFFAFLPLGRVDSCCEVGMS